jgi:hypothetical protein
MYQLSNLGKVPLEIIEVRTDSDSDSNKDGVPRPQVGSDLNRRKVIRRGGRGSVTVAKQEHWN